jgi:hypothetical protein
MVLDDLICCKIVESLIHEGRAVRRGSCKDTTTVVAALSKHVLKLLATLRRSLTWDRGHEMAKHKSFTVDTNVKAYFMIRRALGSAAPMKIPTAY